MATRRAARRRAPRAHWGSRRENDDARVRAASARARHCHAIRQAALRTPSRIRPGIGAKAARGVTHAMRGDLAIQKIDGRIIDVVEVARAPTLRNLRHARKQIVEPARAFHRLLPVAITAPAPPSAHNWPRVRAPRHRRARAWRRSRRAISYKTRDRWSASVSRPALSLWSRSLRAAHRARAAR